MVKYRAVNNFVILGIPLQMSNGYLFQQKDCHLIMQKFKSHTFNIIFQNEALPHF